MFNTNLFETDNSRPKRNKNTFEESDVIFVSDIFVDEYIGGAELTTEALFNSSPYKTFKLKSSELTQQLISQGVQKTWVFFNFSQLNYNLLPFIVSNCHYFITEYDYKFCRFRSIELHEKQTGEPCDCHKGQHGKLTSAFFSGAEKIFWMSDNQKKRYQKRFSFINDSCSVLLSSVFDVKDLEYIDRLRNARKENKIKKEFVILESNSWIKGVEQTKSYLEDQQINFVTLGGLQYHELLRKLSEYTGFAFMPLGGDTCPRIVIEAKLLGLKLLTNGNVQHTNEEWWKGTPDEIESYLLDGHNRFWNTLSSFLERDIKLSGYTTTHNVVKSDYPWKASISSLLAFCDEVVVLDGGSTDGTYEELLSWAEKENKLVVKQIKRDWNHPKFALFDGQQKAAARTLCTGEWCWQLDVDEIVHEDDYPKIKNLIKQVPKSAKMITLPVIEYWGGDEKVRVDVNPWKWRLSKNDPHITHDVPDSHRRYDEEGNLFSLGSDGCDYVHIDNYKPIPDVSFYTPELHKVRTASLQGNKDALIAYENFMNLVIKQLPGVHHYSWYDIKRKIYTYKNYWSKHWTSLYNKKINDLPENNMFFDKKWKDVSDNEIKNLAIKMKEELGGWIFHNRVDFTKPTPWITIKRDHPAVMKEWIEDRGTNESR